MKRLLLLISCIASLNVNAQVLDSVKKDLLTAPDTVQHLHSKKYALIPPVVLAAYGVSSFAFTPVRNLDFSVNDAITRTDPNFNSSKAENYFQFAPVIIVYGLNLAGISGKNTFIDRTVVLGLSGGILALTATVTKQTTHRLRPDGSDYLSFFSGHTSTAFLGAEFLNQEFGGKSVWYSVAGYAIATTTGIFRLYNHDHWFSDVVAGAGFGILATKAGYFVYPYIRNALTHDTKKGKKAYLVPTYQDGATGLAFAMSL
ncbi:phosphatase PAP2 family protein [Mucilaginibacter sp. HMF5004]|uniref:phosphatase PAP2 family protein n=1 Tax=Mucilaginibacter rivuli TaxID=2857527 RepID=UPI001C5F8F5F|nr:phosphatase PAP2 family protein [Mucilaginibacter rivuli]MBW4888653.1 phosphatase PAP2 family protein [Mucilaginibacter rivuli]